MLVVTADTRTRTLARTIAATSAFTTLTTALAGCASGAHAPRTGLPARASVPRSSPGQWSAAPSPGASYREDAAALAGRVPGCNPRPVAAADSSAPGFTAIRSVFATASSTATCTLRGRTVVIFTFTDKLHQTRNEADLRRVDAYFAAGTGWTAAAEEIDEPAGQRSVVQDVALALVGQIEQGNGRG